MSQEKKLEAFLTSRSLYKQYIDCAVYHRKSAGTEIGLLYKRVQKLTRFRMVKCQPAIFCIFVRDTKTLKILMIKKNTEQSVW